MENKTLPTTEQREAIRVLDETIDNFFLSELAGLADAREAVMESIYVLTRTFPSEMRAYAFLEASPNRSRADEAREYLFSLYSDHFAIFCFSLASVAEVFPKAKTLDEVLYAMELARNAVDPLVVFCAENELAVQN